MGTAIQFDKVSKRFKQSDYYAVHEVSCSIKEGELVTILGSSGCGKTTLLKMVNRLYEPDSGKVYLFGEDISQANPVELRRRIGYVIQQVGLFPHMTVEENVGISAKLMKWPSDKRKMRTEELLQLVGLELEEYSRRYPAQLSGGQQQRVGLARALCANPQVMLMDEPFGAIDAINRMYLQEELQKIHQTSKKTILFVTHDINEAFKLGSRVLIMDKGCIQQFDTPLEIVRNPATPFVQSLITSSREQERFWEEALC